MPVESHAQSTVDWDARFRVGDTPWEEKTHSDTLITLASQYLTLPCRLLDVGCGLGTNALHFAGLGYSVTAIDISPDAIRQARAAAQHLKLAVDFGAQDFLSEDFNAPQIDAAVDRGCLHTFSTPAGRCAFVRKMAQILPSHGIWINISGSAENGEDSTLVREHGLPRLTETDLLRSTELGFEVLELRRCLYGQEESTRFLAWAGVFRRR
jgi:SAM-dependent methyltransferase